MYFAPDNNAGTAKSAASKMRAGKCIHGVPKCNWQANMVLSLKMQPRNMIEQEVHVITNKRKIVFVKCLSL